MKIMLYPIVAGPCVLENFNVPEKHEIIDVFPVLSESHKPAPSMYVH